MEYKNPNNLTEGNIVIFKKDGRRYKITQLHPMYYWIKAEPWGYGHLNPKTLYNKKPEEFTLLIRNPEETQ